MNKYVPKTVAKTKLKKCHNTCGANTNTTYPGRSQSWEGSSDKRELRSGLTRQFSAQFFVQLFYRMHATATAIAPMRIGCITFGIPHQP
jgi:hypothetical protein